MRAHRLKIWPAHFRAVVCEQKTCEVRKADRDYRERDMLLLCEFDPIADKMTGRYEVRQITHIHKAEDVPRGLIDGFVVLSIFPVTMMERQMILDERRGILHQSIEWVQP